MFALHDFTFACTFIAYDSIAENPLHFYDIAANQNVSTRTRLCSSVRCFSAHLAQILLYPRSSCLMEYADPQLMFNVSAISVTEIRFTLEPEH